MKQILVFVLLLATIYFPLKAQENILNSRVSYYADNLPLQIVLKEVSEKFNVSFFYSSSLIPVNKRISIKVSDKPLYELMDNIKEQAGVGYKIEGLKIILFKEKNEEPIKQNYSLYGFVEDSTNGERLIGAAIIVKGTQKGTVTNEYGYFSLPLEPGTYSVKCSSLGYLPIEKEITIDNNITCDFKLQTNLQQLQQINIKSKFLDSKSAISPGRDQVTLKMLQNYPSLFGENDPIQFLKMLPGIQSGGEASNGLYVRGSPTGQTAFLLDDAPLYNISHISGLFSSINPDAVKDIRIYKSHIPSKYSGAMGSTVDIRLRDGNNQHYSCAGALGTISSRITVEGPVIKNKASFIFSARRSYLAQILQLFNSDSTSDMGQIYFYDLNGKINYSPNQRNRLYFSAYYSKDNVKQNNEGMVWKNSMLSFRWNYIYSSKLFSNLTITNSKYIHQFESKNTDRYTVRTNTQNHSIKYDLSFYPKDGLHFDFGAKASYQAIMPVKLIVEDSAKIILPYYSGILSRSVYSTYGELIYNPAKSLTFEIGGQLNYIHNYSDKLGKNYFAPEPFLLSYYKISPSFVVKAGYSHNYQFYHQQTVISMILPFDQILFTNNKVKPQYSDNFSLGCYYEPANGNFEFSCEVYYKNMYNQDFFIFGRDIPFQGFQPDSLLKGESTAYGMELSLRKQTGKITGFINYTLSKVKKKESGFSNNMAFSPYYDRPHSISANISYQLTKRTNIMVSWAYMSGFLYNMPIGKYEVNGAGIPMFDTESMNFMRMPAFHHLDLGLQFKFKSKGSYKHNLSFYFYNVYFRKNMQYYTFRDILDDKIIETNYSVSQNRKFSTVGFYVFQFMPAFSYEFKFN